MSYFYFLKNSTHSQMMGIIIRTPSKTVVIDGGTVGDGEQIVSILQNEGVSHIDAWFFTHPHHDHIGAFKNVREEHPEINIDAVYHCFPSQKKLNTLGDRYDADKMLRDYVLALGDADGVHRLALGNTFRFDSVTVRVLRVYNPNILENFVNNSSTVYRIEGERKSLLVLGDLGEEGGDELLRECPRKLLHADYTQLSHHGQSGVRKEFYSQIPPKCCLWATPDWLWVNDSGGGYDSGPWKTLDTRAWMDELGIRDHVIQKDGTEKLPL